MVPKLDRSEGVFDDCGVSPRYSEVIFKQELAIPQKPLSLVFEPALRSKIGLFHDLNGDRLIFYPATSRIFRRVSVGSIGFVMKSCAPT